MVEPTLEEMLDEPIVRLLMKRDGVTRHTVDDDHVPGRGVADGVVTMSAGMGRAGQLASAGRLTRGSSLNGAMVSSVM